MEAVSSQKLSGKCNKVKVIIPCRYKSILIINLQKYIYLFNQIKHIQAIYNKFISLQTKLPTPDNIGDIAKNSLIAEWSDSIFENDKKWEIH